MYSVIRLSIENASLGLLDGLVEDLTRSIPSLSTAWRSEDHATLELSHAKSWFEQEMAILDFLAQGNSSLGRARELGVRVTIDVAIRQEDMENVAVKCIPIPHKTSEALARARVALELSVYIWGAFDDDDDDSSSGSDDF